MLQENIPSEINHVLGGETPDFIAKAVRIVPVKKALRSLGVGLLLLAFISQVIFVFLVPLLMGKEVYFTSRGASITAGPGNLKPAIVPIFLIGLFTFIGLGMILEGINSLFFKSAWFISTAKRLIVYQKNKTKSIDWEQFSGDIEVRGSSENGSITLQMRTGKWVNQKIGQKNSLSRYVSDTIYMAGVKDVFQIEQALRQRIKENDPTPANIL